MVSGKYGHKYVPNEASSLLGAVAIVGFGIFWMVMAKSITGFGGGVGSSYFPLFGIVFILFGVGISIRSFMKAGAYREAHERYQRRRRERLDDRRKSK